MSTIEGVDYERLFDTYFEIREGEKFCRNISIINDRQVEGREFFLVILEDLRWGEVIDTLAIVIEDEDCKNKIIVYELFTYNFNSACIVSLLDFRMFY